MSDTVSFRRATRDDIGAVVAMLADDELGRQREDFSEPLPDSYYQAFTAIDEDPNNELIVACAAQRCVAVAQITFIPYLTYRGGWRALIEGVRVAKDLRSRKIGRQMFEYLIARAGERGCHMVQLTSDKQRPAAIEFYRKLGFVDSHEGMKLHLQQPSTSR